jgi:hypothetical protein
VLAELRAAAKAAAPEETGGLLLGWWQTEHAVLVRHAVEVTDRRATRSSWVRHPHRARRALARALTELAHPLLGYVGDWHSHPIHSIASGRDKISIADTSRQYPHPLVLLVYSPDGISDVRAAHAGQLRPARLAPGAPQ